MKTRTVLALSLIGLIMGASVANGQSLADIARKEEERRKAVKTPSKIYTIQDVQKAGGVDPTVPVPAAPAGAAPASIPGAKPPDAAGAPKEPAAQPPAQAPKDEAYWRALFTDARGRLERSNGFLSALKTQYEVLANRFTAVSDATERGAVVVQMERVKAEIESLQQEIAKQSNDLASLEEEARRAGVPPGWIRTPQP